MSQFKILLNTEHVAMKMLWHLGKCGMEDKTSIQKCTGGRIQLSILGVKKKNILSKSRNIAGTAGNLLGFGQNQQSRKSFII